MPPRAVKRTKLSEQSAPATDFDKHEAFTKWAEDRGVEINGVKAAQLPGRGLGLVTTKAIESGERILFVPEKAMFKPQTTHLKRHGLERTSPHAQLAMSILLAFKPESSHYAVWASTWPTDEDFSDSLPMRWPASLKELLPPSVHQPLQRQDEDWRKDASETILNIVRDHGWHEDDFRYYWSIVNSRSFHWKPPRGRPGLMVLCPFIDYMNHGPTGTSCNVFQTAQGYEVVADRNYDAGEEVLATYGSHSNDKLLVHYGFVCSSSPEQSNTDDDIRLDHLILPTLTDDVRSQLQDVGFLGAYALLPATNEVCFKTQVAVRAMLLSCNEWEYFVANGEDLVADQTPAVNQFLWPLLVEYRAQAVQTLKSLSRNKTASAYQTALLKTRWTQIRDAIDAYLGQK